MSTPKGVEHIVKLFGMSNLMVASELAQISEKFDAAIVKKPISPSGPGGDRTNYPQFNEEIRNRARLMARYYEVFYCLENSIRHIVRERLKDSNGAAWWTSVVPKQIQDEVADRIQKETDSGFTMRSTDPLEFANFGELGEIIKSNWKDFEELFNSRVAVQKVINNLNHLRGPIAHCCWLADDEIVRLNLLVKDWFRLME